MKNKKIRTIKLKINSKKILPKNYFLNSVSKSNISTSNFSSINPDKNFGSIESNKDITKNKNFIFNSPQGKPYISHYINNAFSIDSNTIHRTDLKNKNFINMINQNKSSFIYKRKKGQNMNINNNYKKIINYTNSILLNEYRRRIMKLFFSKFKNYYLIFLRKFFYSFIRNITHFIMNKERLYNRSNIDIENKKNEINTLSNIQLNKSNNNFQILNGSDLKNKKIIKEKDLNNKILKTPPYNLKKSFNNFRTKYMNIENDDDNLDDYFRYNQYSSRVTNTIKTEQKFYDFKNVFISFSNRKNKIKNKIFSVEKKNIIKCFSKKIKDIITKDNRIYITINYIFLMPKKKKRIRKVSGQQIQKINKSLDITQIYSFEYTKNKEKNFLCQKEKLEEKIQNFADNISNAFILKLKRLLFYKLKGVILIKYTEKLIKIIFFNKLGSLKREKSYSNEIFLLDDKLNINIDNFQKLDDHN